MFAICAGMHRSGSTWQYQVVCHLVEQHLQGTRLGFVGMHWMPEVRQEVRDNRWRVLKAHESHRALTSLVEEERAVCFYTYRDIRDVVYSVMHKKRWSFEEGLACVPGLIKHDRVWKTHASTLVQRYEQFASGRTEAILAIHAIATHLGLSLSAGEAEELAALYSLEANQRRTRDLTDRLREQGVDLDDVKNVMRLDPRSQLHWNHIRSGAVGGWRAQATDTQAEALREACMGWLAANGYDEDFSRAPAGGEFTPDPEFAKVKYK